MNAAELVNKHIDIANNYKTVYMWGCFGMPVTENIIREKAAQYPGWYTAAKQAELRKLIGKGYFGFDCVNLTKGILWGWNGSQNAIYGGAKYAGNGVPDVSADGMISKCKNVSTGNWEALVPGEGLWMPGHWGLYIGGGLAVECTPVWKNGVQVTAVGNLGQKSGSIRASGKSTAGSRGWTTQPPRPRRTARSSSTGSATPLTGCWSAGRTISRSARSWRF